jgi:hypothetical protein
LRAMKRAHLLLIAIAASAAAGLAGCMNASLRSADASIAAGNFREAHQQLLAAQSRISDLSPRERRKLKDDLCLTEYRIGAPSYPLAQQQATCDAAVAEPDSQSGPILGSIASEERTKLSQEISEAIASGDIGSAYDCIVQYETVPGADRGSITSWSRQLWSIIDHHPQSRGVNSRGLSLAISQAERQFPEIKRMSDASFTRWVQSNTTVSGTPLVSDVKLGKRTLSLWISEHQLHDVALNLDRFVRVNDAMVARCGCDGKTNIAVQGTGLPAYLVSIDPETRHSEVLILARP